jgi:two-component system cell cycle sensor histidine kinase PleC
MTKDPETPSTPSIDYPMSPVTLRFADEALERRFAIEHLTRALPTVRMFIIAAPIFYGLFGLLDAFIIPDIKAIAWIIRYAVVCPMLAGFVALTYLPLFARAQQLIFAAGMAIGGTGIVVMTAFASWPGNSLYYAGLILVMIYGCSLVHLRYLYATGLSLLLVVLYQLVAVWINPIPLYVLLNNDFFLISAGAIGVFFSYHQEIQLRRDFISTEVIRRGKAMSDELRIQAEAASKAKSDFLAVMSHELRTPLNAIMGFSEVMQHRMFGPIGSEKYAAYVTDIHQTAQHLLSIITDILDLSKADVGKLVLHEENLDLVAIIDHSLRLMREKAAEEGLRLTLQQAATDRPILRGDARLLRQMCLNLLSNAIKFTPAGGLVNVSIAADAQSGWLIHFSDTGIGIAAADLPRIVEPFVQVENALSRKHGGTGLGLPLVKKIMELHGGAMIINSTPGAGTTVTLCFPASRYVRMVSAAVVA